MVHDTLNSFFAELPGTLFTAVPCDTDVRRVLRHTGSVWTTGVTSAATWPGASLSVPQDPFCSSTSDDETGPIQ